MTRVEHGDAPRSSPDAVPHDGGQAELRSDLTDVAQSLHDEYDVRLGAARVNTEIQLVAAGFADAKIRSFVPLLLRRYAGAELRDHCVQQVRAGTTGVLAQPA